MDETAAAGHGSAPEIGREFTTGDLIGPGGARWTHARYTIAITYGDSSGMEEVAGNTRAGLGLHMRRDDKAWIVTHLGTGRAVCTIRVRGVVEALIMAEQVVALGDWTFKPMDGWRKSDPGLFGRLNELLLRNPVIERPRLQAGART